MLETIKKTREYLDYIEEHYNNVQKAWGIIQEKCKDMNFIYDDFLYFTLNEEIKNHDISKLSKEEFVQYRESFYPINDEEKAKSDMQSAWEHHKLNNSHHWENWSISKNTVSMTLDSVHNIVDWMAMGFKFGDTAQEFHEKNKDNMNIPDWAENFMYQIFERIK